jgi:hypothetical protein
MEYIQSEILWLMSNINCSVLVGNCQFRLLSVFSTTLFKVKGQNTCSTIEVVLYVLIQLTRYLVFPLCRRNSLGCEEPCRMRIFCSLFPTLRLRTPAPPEEGFCNPWNDVCDV